jgi:hypothetical protein
MTNGCTTFYLMMVKPMPFAFVLSVCGLDIQIPAESLTNEDERSEVENNSEFLISFCIVIDSILKRCHVVSNYWKRF